jgi:hypothetical protein
MTRNDQRTGYSDKSLSRRIRIMGVTAEASALTRDGLMNRESDSERRHYGWAWVWGVLFVFMALEIARLS